MIQIQYHEPAIFEQVSFLVKILPYAERSPAYPYTNIAVNISISTKAHRDSSDLSWCTTFTIQKSTGSQLCLHESGLVFEQHWWVTVSCIRLSVIRVKLTRNLSMSTQLNNAGPRPLVQVASSRWLWNHLWSSTWSTEDTTHCSAWSNPMHPVISQLESSRF